MKTKGIYLLYRVLQAFGLPVLALYFLRRGLADPAYFRSLAQRLGFLPRTFRQTTAGAIWLHAVSVGEVASCAELLRQLKTALPLARVFVSTSTLAGRAAAEDKLRGLAAGVFFAPVDYVWAVRRVLRCLRPSLVVILETEIWPNLYREAKRIECGLMVVNGRISDRAAPRYFALRWFLKHVLPTADAILVQSDAMRQRWIHAGAAEERVSTGGNLKYDFEPRQAAPDSPVRVFLDAVRPEKIWIAASTMPPAAPADPDEDDAVIQVYQELARRFPGLLLVLAPRRPERFDLAARKLAQAGIAFLRRSQLNGAARLKLPGVLLLDSIGELSGLFFLADLVFIGGTLASRGGHNILEPAFFARPIVAGPHLENFREIAAEFRSAGAIESIQDAPQLGPAIAALLEDPARAGQLGRRALVCAQARRGATARAVEAARGIHQASLPRYRPSQPAFALLWLMSRIWLWGSRRRSRRALARRKTLETPVVSVGNITAGGTGKTPFVLWLSERMLQAGRYPGILTRGHGRHSPQKHSALAAGARVPVEHSGDEPQIFLRSGLVPVGIGPDRARAGRLLQHQFGVDLLLLDDGFQHLRLDRRLDIVLIDGLNPFGGGELLPLGRLRESLDGLRRADVFVVTRSDYSRLLPAIEHYLCRYYPQVPRYRARVLPQAWVEHTSGSLLPPSGLPSARLAAFCALGNPDSFWSTLAALGLEPLDRVVFDDHHAYRPHELKRLSEQFRTAGAELVVTTEKDMLNLCEACDTLLALPLYWLKIGLEIDNPGGLFRTLEMRL